MSLTLWRQGTTTPTASLLPALHKETNISLLEPVTLLNKCDTSFAVPLTTNSSSTAKPFWVPSYPGSGSELFRDLVQTLTGLPAVDITRDGYDACVGSAGHRPATCKSHWPLFPQKAPRLSQPYFQRTAFLLLRNPAASLPSWFNYMHEHHIGAVHHTVQAPETEWLAWRDNNFDAQLAEWKKLLRKWHRGPFELMPVAYERLVNETTGPALLQTVSMNFQRTGIPTSIAMSNVDGNMDEDIVCLWRKVVQQRPVKKRQGHSYRPSFTAKQQTTMLQVLDSLHDQLSTDTVLVDILAGYRHQIANHLRLDNTTATSNASLASRINV